MSINPNASSFTHSFPSNSYTTERIKEIFASHKMRAPSSLKSSNKRIFFANSQVLAINHFFSSSYRYITASERTLAEIDLENDDFFNSSVHQQLKRVAAITKLMDKMKFFVPKGESRGRAKSN